MIEAPVIDNSDSTDYDETSGAAWTAQSDTNAYLDDYYRHRTAVATATSHATWTFDDLTAGKSYEVFATWVARTSDGAPDAQFTVHDGIEGTDNGTVTHTPSTVDHSAVADDVTFGSVGWERLGVYTIHTGTAMVSLSDQATVGKIVVADGVRLVEVPEEIDRQATTDGDGQFSYLPTGLAAGSVSVKARPRALVGQTTG